MSLTEAITEILAVKAVSGHVQVRITESNEYGDFDADVDQGIVRDIRRLWGVGIPTAFSCEGFYNSPNLFGVRYVSIPRVLTREEESLCWLLLPWASRRHAGWNDYRHRFDMSFYGDPPDGLGPFPLNTDPDDWKFRP